MSDWACGNCGEVNLFNDLSCIKCFLDRDTALAVKTQHRRLRRLCPVCFHRHNEGIFCYMFCQGIVTSESNGEVVSPFFQEASIQVH